MTKSELLEVLKNVPDDATIYHGGVSVGIVVFDRVENYVTIDCDDSHDCFKVDSSSEDEESAYDPKYDVLYDSTAEGEPAAEAVRN